MKKLFQTKKAKWIKREAGISILYGNNYTYAYEPELKKLLLTEEESKIAITMKVKDFKIAKQIVEALERR